MGHVGFCEEVDGDRAKLRVVVDVGVLRERVTKASERSAAKD